MDLSDTLTVAKYGSCFETLETDGIIGILRYSGLSFNFDSVMQQFVQYFSALIFTCCFVSGNRPGRPNKDKIRQDAWVFQGFVRSLGASQLLRSRILWMTCWMSKSFYVTRRRMPLHCLQCRQTPIEMFAPLVDAGHLCAI